MERSVLGSAIKTYPSKKNRFSSYRPSALTFKTDDNDLFDQLVEAEVKKQPLFPPKSSLIQNNAFRSAKSYQPDFVSSKVNHPKKHSIALKSIQNIGPERKNRNTAHFRLKHKKKRTKKLGKENTIKYSSRLYASDSDDLATNPSPSLSVYELSCSKDVLKEYNQRRAALEKKKANAKPCAPPSVKKHDTPVNQNNSPSPKPSKVNSNLSGSILDEVYYRRKLSTLQNSPKLENTVFKKPVLFVEKSSDLFLKKDFKNTGQSKSRKRLPFLNGNNDKENEYDADNSLESDNKHSISGIHRNSIESRLFNSVDEKENSSRCLNFSLAVHDDFKPGIVSTPNFERKKSSKFSCSLIVTQQKEVSTINKSKSRSSSCNLSSLKLLNTPSHIERENFQSSPNKSVESTNNKSGNSSRQNQANRTDHSESSSQSSNDSTTSAGSDSETSTSTRDSMLSSKINAETAKCDTNFSRNRSSRIWHDSLITSFRSLSVSFAEELKSRSRKSQNFDNNSSQHCDEFSQNNSYTGKSNNTYEKDSSDILSSSFNHMSLSSPNVSTHTEKLNSSHNEAEVNDSCKDFSVSVEDFDEKYNEMNNSINNSHDDELSKMNHSIEESELSKSSVKDYHSDDDVNELINSLRSYSIQDKSSINNSSCEQTEDHSTSQLSIASEIKKDQSIESSSDEIESLSPIRNHTYSDDHFLGWSKDDYEAALKRKLAFEDELKKITEQYNKTTNQTLEKSDDSFYNVSDFPSHLQFVTTRRKKNCLLPTLNEEETEEDLNNNATTFSTRNSPQPSQHLSSYQPSFFNSQFLDKSSLHPQSIVLAAGKKWRRSFITLKNIRDYGLKFETENEDCKGRSWKKNVQELLSSQRDENLNLKEIEECSTLNTGSNETIISSVYNSTCVISEKCIRPDKARFSLCVNTKQANESGGSVTSSDNSKLFGDKSYVSFINQSRDCRIENCELEAGDYSRSYSLSLERYNIQDHFPAKEVVLRHCKQNEPLPFEECFNDRVLLNCKKIGEGVYGEVFMLKRSRTHCSVLKIIPIEGDRLINGERQKKFEEIVSELIISLELSNLRKRDDYYTDNFAELQRCWCVFGRYPERLIDLWNQYDNEKGSDNDSPKVFTENQLYIILELSHGGEDVESFVFNNAHQALSVFTQVTNALAVAEQAFMFEHRDLHWGNILVSKCKTKETRYIIDNCTKIVKLNGVKVTIIDYTLSRISINNCIVYNDIGQDPDLFTAEGDFQFEVYRLMRNEVRNIWDKFVPKTNIYWLYYLLDKMVNEVRYRRSNTKIHQLNVERLKELYELISDFDSSYQLSCDEYFR